MRTSIVRGRLALCLASSLLLALGASACESQEATTNPGEAAREAEIADIDLPADAGATRDAATQAPSTASKPTASGTEHIPRDRDPEQERKKMSLSKERSAAARKQLERGQLDSAIREARQALKLHEQNVDAMLVIAESFYKQGKYEIVQSVTSSILQVDAERLSAEEASQANNLRGFAYLALGQDGAAMQAFRKAADGDPKNASAWNNVGVQYLVQGDAQTAAACFAYAVELDPRFAEAHLNHGAALRATGQLVAAEQAFKRALELRPDDAGAHFNLGVLYLDADPFPELDTTTRLNRAISELQRFKQRAMTRGTTGPSGEKGESIPGAGRDPAKFGNELVTIAQADLYIEVAKKGIDRERRAAERAQRRKEKEAKAAAEPAPPEPSEGDAAPAPQGPKAQSPGAQSPAPQGPKAQTPAPQGPKTQAPAPQGPKTQAPAPQGPKPQAPAPQGPKTQAPAPQGPKPQAPSPQRPGVQRPGG